MDSVEVFNALSAEQVEADLRACCAAPAWGAAIAAKRPYREPTDVLAAGDAAARELSWDEVLVALAAHPRIGEKPTGDSKEAAWSRREQSAAASSADEASAAELVAVNRAYEEKFGHVFLIFASGRKQADILANARDRLGNDEQAERTVVAEELRKIALQRLGRVLDALG